MRGVAEEEKEVEMLGRCGWGGRCSGREEGEGGFGEGEGGEDRLDAEEDGRDGDGDAIWRDARIGRRRYRTGTVSEGRYI